MASEETNSTGASYGVVFPLTPELTPETEPESSPPDMKHEPDVNSETISQVNMQEPNWASAADSSGLVLLSTLCELSAKQPNPSIHSMTVSEEVVISDQGSESQQPNTTVEHRAQNIEPSSSANVIVEILPHVDIGQSYPSPFYVVSTNSPDSDDTEDSLPLPQETKPLPQEFESLPQGVVSTKSVSTSTTNTKQKRLTKTLKFPPCFICSGKASGSHYGVNSCEACKGFFRRYLMRNEEYKCVRGGNCEIINRNRGNCSGCRLKKCLYLGMSKEKSKLGRYTLARRTETIKEVNKLEGKEETDSVSEGKVLYPDTCSTEPIFFDPKTEMLSRKMSENNEDLYVPQVFSEQLVAVLVEKLEALKPFGPDIHTIEDIQTVLKNGYEQYKAKVDVFGPMRAVPTEEFDKIYTQFGIDVDNRMKCIKEVKPHMEGIIERFCNFAKHIPDFLTLSCRDQSNLLKTARYDFFVVAMHRGYQEEYQMMLGQNGTAYHLEECADRYCSKKLCMQYGQLCKRWQKLNLEPEELSLICALTLAFADRCKLENYHLVERIQQSIVELLQKQLRKTCPETAQLRFTKIIDNLTMMRDASELYLQEYNELCKNKVLLEEMPMMTEFLLEDDKIQAHTEGDKSEQPKSTAGQNEIQKS